MIGGNSMRKMADMGIVFYAVLTLLIITGGCKGRQDSKIQAKPVELEFLSQKQENVDLYNQIFADFTAEYPNIRINQTTTAGSNTSFVARVAANDMPDIGGIYFQPAYMAMMDEKLFVDQTNAPYLDKVNKSVVDLFTYKGKVYALPLTLNGYALYYNVDIYNKYNLRPPETIQELFDNCEKLKAAGISPFAFPFKATGALAQFFERFLNGAVDNEAHKISEAVAAGKSYRDFPEIRNYFEVVYRLVSQYTDIDALSTDNDDVAGIFANQKAAMIFNGTWICSVVDRINPDLNYEAVLVPTISGVQATTCGTVDIALTISADSPYIEQCSTFLNWFLRDDVAQKFAEGDKNPSAVKSVKYEIKHLGEISRAIANGNFSLLPSTYYPAGFRDEISIELQQLFLDGNVDALLEKWDAITYDFYK
jgi:raffinose/stachyose/melibiose transport system substrate-binding protein